MSEHARWDLGRRDRDSVEVEAGYDEAKRAIAIGRTVRECRLALGLSQTELTQRAGMTQPALSRLEVGATLPTIPVLERLAAAMDAELVVGVRPHAAA